VKEIERREKWKIRVIYIEKQCGQSYSVAQGNVLAACISGSGGGSGYVKSPLDDLLAIVCDFRFT
jgi:hypothetical protein